MASRHTKQSPLMPIEVVRSSTVNPHLGGAVIEDAWLDRRAARRFAVEVAASNALDRLPEGYEPARVVVIGRRKRGD